MTTDFRALCVELIASWDADGCDWKPQHQARWEATVARARAALGKDGPAVPDGREPASVVGEPSDEDLWNTADLVFQANSWPTDVIRYARAVLARWGNAAPQPPVEGEVAELVAWLREIAQLWEPDAPRAKQLFRAADLLERLAPQPPSLAEQALAALSRADKDALTNPLTGEVVALRTILSKEQSNTIRRALERLQELEKGNE